MENWQFDWALINASIPAWEEFVFSKEIYWPLHFDRAFGLSPEKKTRLSAGRLCLSLNLLKMYSLVNTVVQADTQADIKQIEALLQQWPVNWEKKLDAETPVRLRQLSSRVEDLRHGGENSTLNQAFELRLMLSMMIDDLPAQTHTKWESNLKGVDLALRSLTQVNEFILDAVLKRFFAEEKYWYLYRKLK